MTRAGQFKPVGTAKPTIGSVGNVERVEEDRVEVLVNDQGSGIELKNVIDELKNVRRWLVVLLLNLLKSITFTGPSVRRGWL
jgi:hypothetical protein